MVQTSSSAQFGAVPRNGGKLERGEEQIQFEHAILATGSVPAVPPMLKIDDPRVMDSTGALALEVIAMSKAESARTVGPPRPPYLYPLVQLDGSAGRCAAGRDRRLDPLRRRP